ncbi:hypothetical protein [Bradyrhizobium diazoefficiens]|uniref:hypothetical protein n=1 Tax=Bradyrhizobium diazoefficiens TaxID=1355477 RepID=UPI0027155359|nr:hypothetical protein [Bradyrhizobium diazoefficiens]WLB34889.1 hypothetical protein QIH78_25745 [Bradyrhizobium diazoefficiens]BCF44623.1 hypothetical protein XF16B_51130 [Bradyrhizobium diazoefficiens]BCF70769.1 hypothetical protein XF19B_51220 [Bradyrhizobium diazoefficiens]
MTDDTKKKIPLATVSSRGLRAGFGRARPGDPSATQTQEQIAEHYRNAKEGDVAVIRETYATRLWFIVTKITGTNPKAGRVYLEHAPSSGYGGRAFYMKSGRNCFAPKGQSSLVMPTQDVLEHAEKFPADRLGENIEIVIAWQGGDNQA